MKQFRTLALLFAVFCLLVLPFVDGNPAISTIAVYTLLFACAAVAWNLFSGYSGYYSLGHAAYFGLGAYALAVMCQRWNIPGGYLPFALVPVAGLFAGALALPLGWVALRARRYTFVVLTLAILFICRLLATNLFDVTGGSAGMYLPLPPWDGDVYTFPFYYVSLALLALALATSWWVRSSKYGLSLLAIRDDEERARSLGVRTGRYKLAAYVLSAFFVGMVGATVVYFVGIIYPTSAFDLTFDVTLVVMTFLGGVGTLAGPVLGAFLLEPVQQFIITQFGSAAAGLDLVIYGAFFLLVLLLVPEGIVPSSRTWWRVWSEALRTTRQPQALQTRSLSTAAQEHRESGQPATQAAPVFQGQVANTAAEQPLSPNPPKPVPVSLRVNAQRARAHRLVPLSTPAAMAPATPAVLHWRCPTCRRPFLLSGNTCYCPRCGFTRPLVPEEQPVSR